METKTNAMTGADFLEVFKRTLKNIMILQGTKVRNEYVDKMETVGIEFSIELLSKNIGLSGPEHELSELETKLVNNRKEKVELLKDYYEQTKTVLGL